MEGKSGGWEWRVRVEGGSGGWEARNHACPVE